MEAFGHALGSVGVALLPFSLIAWFFLTLLAPFVLWTVVRNVTRTRRALERIADSLEGGRSPGSGGVLGI